MSEQTDQNNEHDKDWHPPTDAGQSEHEGVPEDVEALQKQHFMSVLETELQRLVEEGRISQEEADGKKERGNLIKRSFKNPETDAKVFAVLGYASEEELASLFGHGDKDKAHQDSSEAEVPDFTEQYEAASLASPHEMDIVRHNLAEKALFAESWFYRKVEGLPDDHEAGPAEEAWIAAQAGGRYLRMASEYSEGTHARKRRMDAANTLFNTLKYAGEKPSDVLRSGKERAEAKAMKVYDENLGSQNGKEK